MHNWHDWLIVICNMTFVLKNYHITCSYECTVERVNKLPLISCAKTWLTITDASTKPHPHTVRCKPIQSKLLPCNLWANTSPTFHSLLLLTQKVLRLHAGCFTLTTSDCCCVLILVLAAETEPVSILKMWLTVITIAISKCHTDDDFS